MIFTGAYYTLYTNGCITKQLLGEAGHKGTGEPLGGAAMGIQNLSKDVLLITLPQESQRGNELEWAARQVRLQGDRHIVVDFSLVEVLPSGTLGSLMVLQRAANAADRQLVLCAVTPSILRTFRRVGLHGLFRFADDKFAALRSIESHVAHATNPSSAPLTGH